MHSSVTSPFSHDFIKTEIDKLQYQQCFNNYLHIYTCTYVQYSHHVWFLDGRTSILIKNDF